MLYQLVLRFAFRGFWVPESSESMHHDWGFT